MSEPAPLELELVVLAGDALKIVPLGGRRRVSLGRDESNDIAIDHPSVSRQHAVLSLGPPLVIEDLGSANSTSVHEKNALVGTGRTERLRRLHREAQEIAIGASVLLGAVSVVVRRQAPGR